jgi:HSP20 family molecular chaperone IbpA
MSRHLQFNSPFLLGFDEIERVMDRVAKRGQDGYPPYNIEQLEDGSLRIIVAVAGFTKEDLGVTVEDNQLVIRGKQVDEQEKTFLHRGIAARQFQRSFVLADGIEIASAGLENGLLNIDLKRPRPNVQVQNIEIEAKSDRAGSTSETPEIELSAEEAAE